MAIDAAGLSPEAQSAVSEARAGRGKKLAPAVKQELSQPASASAPASDDSSSSSSSAGGSGWSVPLPDFGSVWAGIPGGNAAEKGLLIVFVIIIGLGVHSKLTGTSHQLGLMPSVGNVTSSNAMQAKVAAANPAKASA